MIKASKQKLYIALRGLGIAFSIFALSAHAQQGPSQLNISGGLFNPDGKFVTGTVNFRLEVWDANNTCLLYTEDHPGQDLTSTKGGFSLEIGKGSGKSNLIDAASPTALSSKVFENPGAVPSFSGCAAGVTLSAGDVRLIRVYYDKGSGYTAMTPDVPIGASAYAIVAETLQGKRPTDFVQIRDDAGTDLTQLNLENIFSATNYPRLTSLLSGNFGNQPITNVGTPTNASDAATKGYADANVGGRATDFTGVGAGVGNNRIVVWDAGGNRWTTASPTSFTDATKLPLAGGTMSGAITMGGNDILGTGHITMTAGRTLTLGTYTAATEPALITSLGLANEGASWYNSDENVYKIWNGTAAIPQAYLTAGKLSAGWIPDTAIAPGGTFGSATQVPVLTVGPDGRITAITPTTISGVLPGGNAGGDLTGTYPSPLIAVGAVGTTKIANEAITSAKLNNTSANFGVNRLLITDGATGNTVTYSVCNENEVLRYTTATGWACTNAATLSAVISVNGKTGVVNLNANDLGLGTASLKDYGTNAGELVELDAGGKIPSALMPNGTGTVTNIATGTGLVGGPISSTGTISLANTSVTAGTYGTTTQIPSFVVDQQGRLTWASNLTVSGTAPGGSATGDLSGTYPSPVVAALQGSDVSETAPTVSGQVLRWNALNLEWEPSVDGSALNSLNASNLTSGTVATGRLPALTGDVTSTAGTGALYLGAGVVGPTELENTSVTVGTYGTSTSVAQFSVDAQGRITGAQNVLITGAAPVGAASGDLSGSYPNPTVARLQGSTVSASAPSSAGQVLRWNGSQWEASDDGSALTSLNASNLSSGTVATGRLPALTGDVTSTAGTGALYITPNAVGSTQLAATTVAANSYGSSTQVPTFTVDADGRLTAAANVTITGTAPGGAANGDLSGTYPAPVVAKIQGSDVSATAPLVDGQVLRWNNSASRWEASVDGSALTTLNASNISSGTLNAGRLPAHTGDVTSSAGSAALTIAPDAVNASKILDGSVGADELAATGVTAATYGTSTSVAQFSVDADGRITGATNVLITGAAPVGGAAGDLSGNYPSPVVARLQGSAVSSTAPSSAGQVLRWNGSQWEASDDGSALTSLNASNLSSGTVATGRLPALTGDVTSTAGTGALYIAPNAVGSTQLAATTVAANSYGSSTQVPTFTVDADGRLTAAANVTITGTAPGGTAAGDLSGSYPNPTVAQLQGRAVSASAPSSAGQVLRWNGSQWEADTDGSALTSLNATNISSGTLAAGRLPALSGDVTSVAGSGTLTIPANSIASGKLTITGVTAATYGTGTQVPQFSVDAAGRITGVTNVTITGAAPTGAASGDLSANFPSPVVARLQGSPVSSTAPASAGQVLRWNGSQWEANTDGSALTSLNASNISSGTLAAGRLPALSGDVTAAAGSGVLTIPANSIASGKLTNTGVTAATYGTGTQVPQFSVDAAGRITGVTNVTITGAAPTGAASGDLSANFPSPTVARLQGSPVSSTAPASAGQVLRWNGSQWEANTDGSALTSLNATNISSGTLAAGRLPAHTGDVTSAAGSAALTIVANAVNSGKIADGTVSSTDLTTTGVTAATYGTGTQVPQFSVDAAGRITGVTNVTITGAAPTGAASGDLSANFPSPVVARLQGSPVSASAPSSAGQVLRWNGSQWEANTDGSALTSLNASNISSGTLAAGRLPALSGDVTAAAGSGTLTIPANSIASGKLTNTGVTAATYGTGTQVPQFSVDAAGRITGVTNVTITGAAPTGAASGDLSANFPSPVVARLQGSPVSSTAPASAGQVLRWNGSQWEANTDGSALTSLNATNISSGTLGAGRLPAHTGDVTSAAGSAALTISANAVNSGKIADGTVSSTDLTTTGVTAATYGTGTQVPQFSVDAAGRITGVTNVTITGAAPTGAASGDLSANFPSPVVARLQGSPVSSTAPASAGQVLRWNGSQWEASADGSALSSLNATNISSGTLPAGRLPAHTGDVTSTAGSAALTIAPNAVTSAKMSNTGVTAATYGTGTQVPQFSVDAAGRITGVTNVTITGAAPTGAASGDLSANFPSPTVARLQGSPVSASAPSSAGQVLRWNGSQWEANTDGSALTSLNATNISSGTLAAGRLPAHTGDVTSAAGSAALTIAANAVNSGKIADGTVSSTDLTTTGVTAATYGTGTQVPQFSVDAAGRITGVTNVTITGAAPTGAASGDLSANFPSPVVARLQGSPVSSTAPASAGQVLRWNGSQWEASADGSALTSLNATNISSGTLAAGRLPALSGDVTAAAGSGALTIPANSIASGKLTNTGVTAATYGTGTQVPQFSVDAAGRITGVTNVTITGAAPTGAASGDLSANFPSPVVARLQGSPLSSTAPASAGQVLRWNGSQWEANTDGSALTALNATNISSGTLGAGRLPAHTGDVTSAAGSAALTIAANAVNSGKIADGTVSSTDLTTTGVTAATYGTGTQVPQFSVDAAGRITGVTNVTITGAAPTGAASGDLSANFPSPVVARLQGSPVSSTAPASAGQVLRWNGSQWEASADGSALTSLNATNISSGTLPAGRLPAHTGDVTSAAGSAALTIATGAVGPTQLASTSVTVGTYGTSTSVAQFSVDADGRITGATNVTITGAAPTGAASGDLSANFPSPTVARLQGSPVSASAPSSAGQVLRWNGSQWEANTDGSALTSLNATNISSGTLPAGRLPAHTGDVTSASGSAALTIAPNAVTSAKMSNTGVTAATYGTGTQVPQFSVDAAGRITGVTNVTITGAAPTGAASGDLSANFPSPVVARLQGSPVSSTAPASAGQVLRWNGSQWEANTDGSALTALNATNISSGTLPAARLPAHTGDVTSAAGSAALTIATGAVGPTQLASTSVTVGTYGTSTSVAQFSVDADGRITGATNVTITGAAPTGAASGDLSANFPSPTVARLQGSPVSASAPSTAGQVLRWNGSQWEASVDGSALTTLNATNISSGTLAAGRLPAHTGDVTSSAGSATLTIAPNAVTSAKMSNTGVTAATYGTGTQVPQFSVDAAGRITGVTNVTITGAAPTGTAGGDLSGSYPNPTTARLQGRTVSATAPSVSGQVLRWNNANTTWEPSVDGSALTTLNATNLSSGTVAAARLPAFTGDVTASAGSTALGIATGAVGPTQLASTTVSAGTYGSATQVPQFAVDADGRITGVNLVTVSGVAPSFPLNGSAGSASAPTYSFTSTDSDTGMFRPAADSIGLSTAGTERLSILANGNVGIGTTAPTTKAEIMGETRTTSLTVGHTGTAGAIGLARSSDGVVAMGLGSYNNGLEARLSSNWNSGYLTFYTNNGTTTERMRIDSAGNVGIGTTSPSAKLNVSGGKTLLHSSDSNYGQLQIANPSTSEASVTFIANATATGTAPTSSGGDSHIWGLGTNLWGIGGDKFSIGNKAAGVALFTVQSNGNVGIGTTSPTGRLQVRGKDDVVDVVSFMAGADTATAGTPSINVGIGTANPGETFEVAGTGLFESSGSIAGKMRRTDNADSVTNILALQRKRADATAPGAGFGGRILLENEAFTSGNMAGSAGIEWGWEGAQTNDTTARDGYLSFRTTLDNGSDGLGGTERMRITSNGYVGIGMTNPSVALDVTGDIEYTGTIADVSDQRLKENIQPLDGALETLRELPIYSYTMKNDPKHKVEFGVMAQDLQKLVPQLVHVIDPDSQYMGVNYIGLIPWSIRAIQTIDRDVASLKAENAELKARMDKIEAQNKELAEQVRQLIEIHKNGTKE